MKFITTIVTGMIATSLAVGEEPIARQSTPATVTVKPTWEQFDVVERILDLKSDHLVQWFYFREKGSVSASFGVKGGAVTGPILTYRISGRWLHLIDSDGKVIFQMRLLEVDKNEIVVDNGIGGKDRYEFYRNKSGERKE